MIKKLFLDFDNVIVDSTTAFCKTYNNIFKNDTDFKPAISCYVEEYNFSDQCPLLKHLSNGVQDIFSSQMFFDNLEFMDDNTYDIIKRASEKFETHITTIGTFRNLALKTKWIQNNLPFIEYVELLYIDKCNMNKSVVNMGKGSIFFDDVLTNLESSNAEVKYVFGDEYKWNKTNKYQRCFNWTEVEKVLF